MSDTPQSISECMVAAMRSIEAIAKRDRNTQQGFNFRGIDAVINGVGPVLREHGIFLLPQAGEPTVTQYDTKNGTRMNHVLLPVCFRFQAADGSYVECCTVGEASDAGDKVISKAHSVALRIALLEVFAIPTDEPDPDSEAHERATPMSEAEQADAWFRARGWDDAATANESWTTLKQAMADLAAGDAKEHIRAWAKGVGLKQSEFTPDLAARWDEMLSHTTKAGAWKAGYTPPAVADTTESSTDPEEGTS